MSRGASAGADTTGDPSNIGWIAGFVIILAVLAIGGVLWFTYHPM